MDGQLTSPGWSRTILRMVTHHKKVKWTLGIWNLDLTHKTFNRWQLPWMVPYYPWDSHPATQRWSTTKRKCTVDMELGTKTSLTKITPGNNCHWWSRTLPRMVIHHPKYSHQLSQRWSPISKRIVTNHPQDGHPPSKGWPPTNPRKATIHHPDGHPLPQRYGHTPSQGCSPTNSRMITHHPRDIYHPPSPGWSTSLTLVYPSLFLFDC